MGVNNPEEEVKEEPKLSHLPAIVYKSRTEYLISKLESEEDGVDREDHVIQLPW
jgi:hypothetical protein